MFYSFCSCNEYKRLYVLLMTVSQRDGRASIPIAVRVTAGQHDMLTSLAERFGVSQATLIRWGVEALLDHVEEGGGSVMLPFRYSPPAPSAGTVEPPAAEE